MKSAPSDNIAVGMSLNDAMGTSNFSVEASPARSGLDLARMSQSLGLQAVGTSASFNTAVISEPKMAAPAAPAFAPSVAPSAPTAQMG